MSDLVDLDKIESYIKNIESEIVQLLNLLTNESIPNRSTMIKRDFFKRLQEFDIIQSTEDFSRSKQSSFEDEPRNTVEFIKSILENIPANIVERKRYLEKLLGYIGSISDYDKTVLIKSLLNESPEKIKAAISDILEAFS